MNEKKDSFGCLFLVQSAEFRVQSEGWALPTPILSAKCKVQSAKFRIGSAYDRFFSISEKLKVKSEKFRIGSAYDRF